MLQLAIGALIVSLIAGAFGFSRVSKGAALVAKVTFAIFLVIALIAFGFLLLTGAILF